MKVEPAVQLVGHVAVPGDKSISHRSVLIGALADGETHVHRFGRSGDTQSTIDAARALGANVEDVAEDELIVRGVGLRGLRAAGPIDCGNAGTLMRLAIGVLAGQRGRFELTGDESLSSRPMERIAAPLREMGATIETTEGHAPVIVAGSDALHGVTYELPVASAQVKSAVLLAGLNADGPTTVVEPLPTRDHTELMLESAGVRVRRSATSVTIDPAASIHLDEIDVPGDISSAAPFLAAAALVPGSDITIHDVNLNPRRTGFLDVLERMGAHLAIFNRHKAGRASVGDVQIQYTELGAVEVTAVDVPLLVDELPLVALLASHARGKSVVRGAAGAAREGERPHRGGHRRPALLRCACQVPRGRVGDQRRADPAERRPDRCPRRPSNRDARSRRRARVEGRRRDRGRRDRRYKLPRVFPAPRIRGEAMIVAIDGPAGAGKSTVARALAERLGFRYLDTGAMYRALTWLAMRRGLDLGGADALAELARAEPVTFDGEGRVWIAGTDVTSSIRDTRIDRMVPVVARHSPVREVMRERQRQLGSDGDVVIEGRDIGTVVAPGARGEGVSRRRPRRAGEAAHGRPAGDRRRRARDRHAQARPERTPSECSRQRTRRRSTRPNFASKTSSSASSSSCAARSTV